MRICSKDKCLIAQIQISCLVPEFYSPDTFYTVIIPPYTTTLRSPVPEHGILPAYELT